MTSVSGYRFHNLTLALREEEPGIGQDPAQTLADLSWTRVDSSRSPSSLTLLLHW